MACIQARNAWGTHKNCGRVVAYGSWSRGFFYSWTTNKRIFAQKVICLSSSHRTFRTILHLTDLAHIFIMFLFCSIPVILVGLNLCGNNCLTASILLPSAVLFQTEVSILSYKYKYRQLLWNLLGLHELLKYNCRSRENGGWSCEKVALKSSQTRFQLFTTLDRIKINVDQVYFVCPVAHAHVPFTLSTIIQLVHTVTRVVPTVIKSPSLNEMWLESWALQ